MVTISSNPINNAPIAGAEMIQAGGGLAGGAPAVVQATKKATHFAEQWIQENLENPALHSLKEGEAVKLSRRLISKMHSLGELSYSLNRLYKEIGFDRSVIIVCLGPNKYTFVVQRHKNEMVNKDNLSLLEKQGFRKVFNDEGGINKLLNVDSDNGLELLHRKPKANNNDALCKMTKQKKSENALLDVPLAMKRFATGAELSPQLYRQGVKPLKGSLYRKMSADGQKYFNYDPANSTLAHPASPEVGMKALRQVADTLSFMHGRGIAHRDLKIENLLFDDRGNAYVADFDISVHLNDPTTKLRDAQALDMDSPSTPNNELLRVELDGTPALLAPWLSGLIGQNQSYLSIKTACEMKQALEECGDDMSRRRALLHPFYTKADSYALALMAYLFMCGKYPDYVYENRAWHFGIYMANCKNNRDYDDRFSAEPEQNGQNAEKIKRDLAKAVKAGYSQVLADWVWHALSPDIEEVPTALSLSKILSQDSQSRAE